MYPQSSRSSLDCVDLEGKNVGASMILQHRGGRELEDFCSINIYINNNIQGVNNSILVGSEVQMRDPGVCLSFRDVRFDDERPETRRMNGRDNFGGGLGLFGMFACAILSLFLLSSLFQRF
ncbi:hypothetical protein RJ641_030131 [Dillenia turbinata]|uniref:Uncharacterized protein n=1 Tax=Dillenia turbinata TaxID=194707 RepID=A0AAN8VV29_9MAGN